MLNDGFVMKSLPCFSLDEVENHDAGVTSLGVYTLLTQIPTVIYTGMGCRPVHQAGSHVHSLTLGRSTVKVL